MDNLTAELNTISTENKALIRKSEYLEKLVEESR